MSQFYDICSNKVTFTEAMWDTKNPLVLTIFGVLKLLHLRLPNSADDPTVDSTLPFVTAGLPENIVVKFDAPLKELWALGFCEPVCHIIHDASTQTTIHWATLRHESGKYFARIHNRVWQKAQKPERGMFVLFFTEFADGKFLVSSNGKPDMAAPDSVAMTRMRGATIAALWAAHQQTVDAKSSSAIMLNPTPEAVTAAGERLHVLTRDFHLARGVFRVRSSQAETQAQADTARIIQASAEGWEAPGVMVELEKLQEQSGGWGNSRWLLLLSLALFVGVGFVRGNWKFTLWLVPVLFFHEAGHWLAMRLCRYRNLQMFFIPMFGAAVSGQKLNVPGWKKAIVSLAGPVPGIALGVVFALVFFVAKIQWLNSAALLLLVLNGFNLLPFLPLDGGHVLHTVLFCRHRWLDVVFRGFAIVGLIALGVLGAGRFLAYIAIPLAIGLPVALKLGRITEAMRARNLPPPLPGDDKIPTAAAQPIIAAVKAEFTKNANDKIIAQHTLQVYEAVNARPPNVWATLALLGVHGGSLALAVVVASLLYVGKHSGLGAFFTTAVSQPRHKIACDAVQSTGDSGVETNHNLVVVTAANRQAAHNAFASFRPLLPAHARLMEFGDSLLLTLPADDSAAREQWFGKFQGVATNAFVAVSNQPVLVFFAFIAPNTTAATNLETELDAFFAAPQLANLTPPWSAAAATPAYERAERERMAWQSISRANSTAWRDPTFRAATKKINEAIQRGDMAEVNRLNAEQDAASLASAARELDRLRQDPATGFDPELFELHAKLDALAYTNRNERTAILTAVAAKMGVAGSNFEGVSSGYCVRTGLIIRMNALALNDATTGLPEILSWLCQRQHTAIHYSISQHINYGEDESESN